MTDFKTGDILLFKGNGFFSKLIMAMPGANYSHVAFFCQHSIHGPCVFESTSISKHKDKMTGNLISGVQIAEFEDRVNGYDGKVYKRELNKPLSNRQVMLFEEFVYDHHATPYEEDNLQLARAELDIFPWHRNKQDEKTMFCSELIASQLRYCGVMPPGQPTNEFTPSDFAKKIDLINGFEYSKVTPL